MRVCIMFGKEHRTSKCDYSGQPHIVIGNVRI